MTDFLKAFIRNTVFANVVLSLLIGSGFVASQSMVKEFFPEFSVNVISITVPYPGADPQEVEEGISRKIEEAIDGLEGIKQYDTVSMENMARAFVEVEESYDVEEVKDRVRNQIEAIPNFPVDAEKPIISELTLRNEVIFLALWGAADEKVLKEWAERTKDDLTATEEISQVVVMGTRDYEINIEVSEERLREYGLSFEQVTRVVRQNSLNLGGGNVRTKGEEVRLRTLGRKYTGEDFASIVLLARPGGELIMLDRVATIRDGFTEDAILATFNGQPAAMIGVFKTQEEDAIAIARRVRQYVDEMAQVLPAGNHISIWSDRSILIQDRIDLLRRNGLIGLTLVFLLLWLFLDLRLSFWVSLGIPVSLGGAAAIMWAFGGTINMISLFSLIMVLGIIVDDAIVVGEAIYFRRKSGDSSIMAAVNGVREVGWPVIAAVTTTVAAFIPLFFVGGIMGKFIAIMPVVVISALLISLAECFITLPAHLGYLPDLNTDVGPGHPWKQRAKRMRRGVSHALEYFVDRVYEPFLAKTLRWRYVTLCAAISLLLIMAGLLGGGFINFVMFPEVDGNDLIASVELPRGTPVEITKRSVDDLREAIERVAARVKTASGEPVIKNIYAVAGEQGEGFEKKQGSHYGEVRVELLKTEERGIHYKELNRMWEEEVGHIPGALSLRFTGIETGPPGSAIDIWLQGHDLEEILAAAEELKEKLRGYDGVYQVEDSFRPGKNELQLALKPEARTLGLTVEDLARQVYAGYYGAEAVRFQRGRDDVRVKVRYTEEERSRLAELDQVRIRTPQGYEAPFFSVADVVYGPGLSSITRTDGMRRISVTADVDYAKTTPDKVLNDLVHHAAPTPLRARLAAFFKGEELPANGERFMDELAARHPGLKWSFSGPKEDSREAFSSLKIGFPLALFGIYVIIATIFRSYLQPLIIMVTVPFGIIGAVLSHFVMGYDITMLSVFGMVALAGVVVNDAIVLIECVNEHLARGAPFFEAVERGGARRFRAIFLTTATTCGGLAPLIIERDLQAQFLIPMALSISGGVAFATLLTLVLIPCLLAILNDIRCFIHAQLYGRWPEREILEPSRLRYVEEHTGMGAAQPAPVGK